MQEADYYLNIIHCLNFSYIIVKTLSVLSSNTATCLQPARCMYLQRYFTACIAVRLYFYLKPVCTVFTLLQFWILFLLMIDIPNFKTFRNFIILNKTLLLKPYECQDPL